MLCNLLVVHIYLHHDGRCETVFDEVLQFIGDARLEQLQIQFDIAVIGEFTVELPANVPGLTGLRTLHKKKNKAELSVMA